MRTSEKRKVGKSLNSERNPYMRDDYWASGYFDFLWKAGISENYKKRLDAIKLEAVRSNKNLVMRQSMKPFRFSNQASKRNH